MVSLKRILFTFFLFFCSFIYSQNKKELLKIFTEKDSLTFYTTKAKEFITKDIKDSVAKYYKRMIPFSKTKNTYKDFIDFSSELGHYYEGSGSFEKSIETYQNALALAEFYNDKIYSSKMFQDISQTYRIFHNYEKAIIYGKKAYNILTSNSRESLIQETNALNVIAAAYNENNKSDSALIYQKKI